MIKSRLIFLLLCIIVKGAFAQDKLDIELISDFLTSNYPYSDTIYYCDLMYDIETPIDSVLTPVISSKSGLRFYKTQLRTSHHEYQKLNIALVIDNENNIHLAHSPTFDNNQDDFNNFLIGLKAVNDSIKGLLVREIAFIFAEITYNGSIKNVIINEDYATADLFHNDRIWRRIRIDFEKNGIKNVSLINTKKK